MKLQDAVSAIARWRLNSSLYSICVVVNYAERAIAAYVSHHSLTARSSVYWMNEVARIDARFSLYFLPIALLHVARKISRNGFNAESVNILATVLSREVEKYNSILSSCKNEQNASDTVKLLQKSAVEHLTTYRQIVARDFDSVATIVTTDFEALYAYKRGDYQRCLQLSTQNVHTLLNAVIITNVPLLPELIQLLDDDIASLTALTLIVNPKRGYCSRTINMFITQVTLSLYLMTQCQLKLHYSVTSLAQTLHYIKVAYRKHPRDLRMNQLTLKLAERKVRRTIVSIMF